MCPIPIILKDKKTLHAELIETINMLNQSKTQKNI